MPIEFTPFLGILAGAVITLLVIAFVIIVIIRCKYRARRDEEPNIKTAINSETDRREYLHMNRQPHPDVISGNKSRGETDSNRDITKYSGDTRVRGPPSKLSMISDENMWIRDAASPSLKKSVLNITVNPSESPDSWTPLLHNLNQESNL